MAGAIIVRVAPDDPRVTALRAQMAAEMAELYGRPRHAVPAEHLDPASFLGTWLALQQAEPVATAALRRIAAGFEAKRMFVTPAARGCGLAGDLLTTVEHAARAAGADELLLHTGQRQLAALALYRRRGYVETEIFAPYTEVPESTCLVRTL